MIGSRDNVQHNKGWLYSCEGKAILGFCNVGLCRPRVLGRRIILIIGNPHPVELYKCNCHHRNRTEQYGRDAVVGEFCVG